MDQQITTEAELSQPDQLVAYFGYGSLVNRATLRTAYVSAQPVRLHGWRRCWRPRHHGLLQEGQPSASLLSARQVTDSVIEGLLVYDRAENLAAVDERERGYDRVAVPLDRLQMLGGAMPDCPVYVYEAQTNGVSHDPHDPILQSYLDAVLQGFLAEFGKEGVRNFLATTDALRADRHEPIYPRAVRLSPEEQLFFDDLLQAHRARTVFP